MAKRSFSIPGPNTASNPPPADLTATTDESGAITGTVAALPSETPAPESAPAKPSSADKPIKPGVRRISLAQARAHHASR